MMKNRLCVLPIRVLACRLFFVCLTLAFYGCAHHPTFPYPGVPVLQTAEDFEAVRTDPLRFQKQDVQLAGRLIGEKKTPEGIRFLAEWLPFPENTYAGPETRSTFRREHPFYMHLAGTVDVDYEGRSQGNEFLLLGRFTGLEEMLTLFGSTRAIPSFTVHCVHMWKTAATDLRDFIWMQDDRYPPPLQQTYCAGS